MSQITIDSDRLAQIRTFDRGGHRNFEAGYCAMEAVAYIAREPWSDKPECVCPVIGTFMRAWNDGLPDPDRTRLLLPLVPRLVGTRSTGAVESRRALMATDWLVRVMTPAWLRLAKLDARADALEALPEIRSTAQARSIYRPIATARRDARDAWQAGLGVDWPPARVAAMEAGRDAAASAGWRAARDAAKLVAWGASDALDKDESDRRLKLTVWLTVRDGAKEAVDAAAWVGAKEAARKEPWHIPYRSRIGLGAALVARGAKLAAAAARDAMRPTVESLQPAALDLVNRMIEVR